MNAATLLLAAVLGAVVLAIHLLDKQINRSGGKPQGARWASGRDLRELRVPKPAPGRLTLGRHRRHLLAAEERASVIVVAPAQSGKTTGLAIPALLEWEGPAVAASVKSDLLLDTLHRRRELGRAMIFDPTRATGIEGVCASPLMSCLSWRESMRVAHWLAGSARSGSGGLEDSEFWYAAAEKLLAPLLFAAATSGGEMADVIRWLNEGPAAEEEVSKLLEARETDEDALQRLARNLQPRGAPALLDLHHRGDDHRRLLRPPRPRSHLPPRLHPRRAAERRGQHPLPLRPRPRAGAAADPVRDDDPGAGRRGL